MSLPQRRGRMSLKPLARQPDPLLWLAALLATCLPALLAYNLPPSATLLNQCVAVAVWGGFVLVLAPTWRAGGAGPVLAALAVMALGVGLSWWPGALPSSLALSGLGLLAAAAVMVVAGAQSVRRPGGVAVFEAFAGGLLAAGVLSAVVALVQVFAPQWTDGAWIATSGLPGRAVGNLRQPNHLCSLLLWGVVAAVALMELGRLPRALAVVLVALMVFAMELSASRTGAAGLVLLALWAALDRRLSRTGRVLLLATLLMYALSVAAMAAYGHLSHQTLGAEARLAADAGVESPNSRLNIWRTAWALVQAQPLTGVGFGEFNFAWTLTAFPGRPTAFFDHSHNLPLQLAVELGLPAAALVLGLLGWSLWLAWRRNGRAEGAPGVAARSALMLVLLIGLHSLVEYPLWYAYFLLPAAFAWGVAVARAPGPDEAAQLTDGGEDSVTDARPHRAGLVAGALLVLGGAGAVLDYQRVVVIYAPGEHSGPLAERIAAGQRSPLFAHHADYAAATTEGTAASLSLAFQRAPHQLLDTRLMIAWTRWLSAQGQPVLASTLVARIREFRNAEAQDFLDECRRPEATDRIQCKPPLPPVPWQAFLSATP
ncbi:MAG: polymerase [Burkholderiales bacterium PBB5]|nr:MAG: polymerase [Burkholderiales bacterium PBB5]